MTEPAPEETTPAPVPPFGATVSGVTALVPEARLADGPLPPGKFAVRVEDVERWVRELSARLAMRLDRWQDLADVPRGEEPTSDRDQLVEFARDLVHQGAASYLEAARHPERARPNDTSYAAVLWARFEQGLAELAAWLERRLAAPAGDDVPAPSSAAPAFSFPAPLFGDGLRF